MPGGGGGLLGDRDNQCAIGAAHRRIARVLPLEDPPLDLAIDSLAFLPSSLGEFGDRLPRAITDRKITGAVVNYATWGAGFTGAITGGRWVHRGDRLG